MLEKEAEFRVVGQAGSAGGCAARVAGGQRPLAVVVLLDVDLGSGARYRLRAGRSQKQGTKATCLR